MEIREPFTVLVECTLVQPLWRTEWWFLKTLKIVLLYDPEIPLLGIYPEKTCNSKRCMHPNVQCGTIYNSQEMEGTENWELVHINISTYISTENWYIYIQQSIRHKKVIICSNVNEPRDYLTKWNKSQKDKYHMISLLCGI